MLPILIAAALVAFAPQQEEEEAEPGIVTAAPVVYGGAGYQAAWDRAQRYEADGRLGVYREQTFGPAMNAQLEDIYHACVIPVAGQLPPTFTLVVSFAASGQVDGVFADRRSTASQCMAERFANLTAPPPPVADFAEEIRIVP